MKKSSKRTLSRFLAGVMIVTSVFGSTYVSAAETVDAADATAAVEESVTSDAAVDIEQYADEDIPAAEEGKAYSFDFATATNPDTNAEYAKNDPVSSAVSPDGIIRFLDNGNGSKMNNAGAGNYGLAVKPGSQVKISVAAGRTKISFFCSSYAPKDGKYTVTNSAGNAVQLKDAEGYRADGMSAYVEEDKTYNTVVYNGDATVLTFTYEGGGRGYLGNVTTENTPKVAPIGEAKSFKLFLHDIAKDGTIATGEYTKVLSNGVDMGDTSFTLIGNGEEQYTNYGKSFTQGLVVEGKTVDAYKAGNRPKEATSYASGKPKAGDGTAIIFTPAGQGMLKIYFATAAENKRINVHFFKRDSDERVVRGDQNFQYFASTVACKVGSDCNVAALETIPGESYVISSTGDTNDCAFVGFDYIVDSEVETNINWETEGDLDFSTVKLIIKDKYLGTVADDINCTPNETSTSKLLQGHTYTIESDDPAVGAELSDGTDEFVADGNALNVKLRLLGDVTIKGKFVTDEGDAPAGTVTSISFTNMKNGRVYEGIVSTDGTYTATVKPGNFNTSVVANGYATYDRVKAVEGAVSENDVYLESLEKDTYCLTDEYKAMVNGTGTVLKFEGTTKDNNNSVNFSEGAKLIIPVKGKKIVTVTGWYSGKWQFEGDDTVYETDKDHGAGDPTVSSITTDGTQTEVVVNILANNTYLDYVKILSADAAEFKDTLVVGDGEGQYKTIREAVDAVKAMPRPEGEEGRVTIKLDKDVQEQIVFDAPYITLDGQGHEINWYYGTGSKYYSVDEATGLYSERLFRDKYEKAGASGSLWGGVAIIRGDNFIAENTVFKNTFNYELTEKEVADGAEVRGKVSGEITDPDVVTTYAAKERSNAFYIEAKNIEIYNCQILASQDTFGRNGNTTGYGPVYVKDSVIGGNTDYICGEFAAVFDNCELRWRTYTDEASVKNNANIGYIVAPKTNPYIFRNCYVTVDEGTPDPDTVRGMLGRTWGDSSNATFINLETNGHILTDAWGAMNSGDEKTAKFAEYNTTVNGVPFATSSSIIDEEHAVKLTKDEADKLLSDDIIADILGNWEPKYYELAPVDNKVEPDGVWGDVDKSGVLTSNDAALVFAYTLKGGMIANTANDKGELKYNFTVADVDADSAITANDAANILTKVVDPSFKFAVEDSINDPDANKINVYIVGDSTACHYASTEDPKYWYKRVGFGDKVADYLTDDVNVVNLALSGRSSKSFATGINENGNVDSSAVTNYATLKDNIKEGDFLIIAWGHNDEKTDVYRHTDGVGDETVEGSFQNSLYNNYIKIAQDAKAEPILVTPIIRGNASGTLSDNDVHLVGDAKVDYGQAIRDLGTKLGITVIDQLANTKNLYETITATEAWSDSKKLKLEPPQGYAKLHAAMQDGGADTTHLNAYGASYVAYMLASDIAKSTSGLAKYVKAGITAPEFKHEDCYNTAWEAFDESEYIPSSIWKVTAPWAGSVFGEGVGTINEDSHENHDIIENIAEKSVQLIARNNKGKVQSSSDGFVMYFQEIDAKQDFTLTATAHINSYNATVNQSAFGLILRDNMFTDYAYSTSAPYVLVGNVAQNSGKQQIPYFRRLSEAVTVNDKTVTLDTRAALATEATADTFKPGDEIKLEISRKGDAVTVKYGDMDPVTYLPVDGDYKCDLTKVRADKDYVGVCVTRDADITFKDIDLQLR